MKTERFLFILVNVALVLCVARDGWAQSPNIASYQQQAFLPGVDPVAGTPAWTNIYQASAAVCNQVAPAVPATVINPTQIFFDDAAVANRVCILQIASTLLPALPNQPGYVTTLTQTDTVGQTSARSAASNPFSRQGVPVAPANVKVR